ncbi:hypothetical protein KW076_02660 [Micrococcus porci]|uniref:hypothetical protein n=2 Tax=Micrococcus TaxID=1269 RepID=UPI001CC9D908|nr:hypothetical protein [Micrococcus porci]UBH25112.1 hypothetical protein KW076_02660 [Micrococcus porci]
MTAALERGRPLEGAPARPATPHRRARCTPPWPRPGVLALAAVLAALLALAGAAVGHSAAGSLPAGLLGGPHTSDADWTLTGILGRNLGAALLVFGGVVTGGALTAVTLPLVGVWVGATLRLALDAAGWEGAVGATVLYAPLEFAGVLLAAVAGLVPLAAALLRPRDADVVPGPLSRYLGALPSACLLIGCALLLITAAGVVEHLVVSGR